MLRKIEIEVNFITPDHYSYVQKYYAIFFEILIDILGWCKCRQEKRWG